MSESDFEERSAAVAAEEAALPAGLPVDRIGLILGPILLIAWLLFVPRGELTPEAHRLCGIFLFTVFWWITEPIPIAATGLAALVLAAALDAVPPNSKGEYDTARTILRPFGDPSLFFLLGGTFIGQAMARHGLDRRLALSILRASWAGRSPATVLLAVGLGVSFISMGISNTAATAMMFPVTMGMIAVLSDPAAGGSISFIRSRYASALLLMTAYASSVGGIATPIGTATNIVAMSYFKRPEYFGQPIDFLRWSLIGLPMMLCIYLGLYFWLRLQAGVPSLDMPRLRTYLSEGWSKLGPWRQGEINTLVVFFVVLVLWVTPGFLALFADPETQRAFSRRFPEEITALLAPVLLFLLPIDWRQWRFTLEASDFRKVDWGTVLLFGSALALGNLLFLSGLAQQIGRWSLLLLGSNDVWMITGLAIFSGILLSEFTSNVAAATTLIPVILTLCVEAAVDPRPPLLGVTFGASFGSALPVSTPPNAIVYSSGLLPVRRMVLAGVGLDIIAGIVIWLVLRVAFSLNWRPFA